MLKKTLFLLFTSILLGACGSQEATKVPSTLAENSQVLPENPSSDSNQQNQNPGNQNPGNQTPQETAITPIVGKYSLMGQEYPYELRYGLIKSLPAGASYFGTILANDTDVLALTGSPSTCAMSLEELRKLPGIMLSFRFNAAGPNVSGSYAFQFNLGQFETTDPSQRRARSELTSTMPDRAKGTVDFMGSGSEFTGNFDVVVCP